MFLDKSNAFEQPATPQRVNIFTPFYSNKHMFLYKKLTFVLAVTSLNVGGVVGPRLGPVILSQPSQKGVAGGVALGRHIAGNV